MNITSLAHLRLIKIIKKLKNRTFKILSLGYTTILYYKSKSKQICCAFLNQNKCWTKNTMFPNHNFGFYYLCDDAGASTARFCWPRRSTRPLTARWPGRSKRPKKTGRTRAVVMHYPDTPQDTCCPDGRIRP